MGRNKQDDLIASLGKPTTPTSQFLTGHQEQEEKVPVETEVVTVAEEAKVLFSDGGDNSTQEQSTIGIVIPAGLFQKKKRETKSEQLHIYVKPSTKKLIETVAKKHKVTVSNFVGELLEAYCKSFQNS